LASSWLRYGKGWRATGFSGAGAGVSAASTQKALVNSSDRHNAGSAERWESGIVDFRPEVIPAA